MVGPHRTHSQFTPMMRKLLVMFDGFVVGKAARWAAGICENLKDPEEASKMLSICPETDVLIVIPIQYEEDVQEFLGRTVGFDKKKTAKLKDDHLNLEIRIGDAASIVSSRDELSTVRNQPFYHFNSDSYYSRM